MMRSTLIFLLAAATGVLAALPASAQTTTLTRETKYTYNQTTGLLESETVDPTGTHCVETVYAHDAYGNRATVTVQPCVGTTSSTATFEKRVTTNTFAAGTNHPAGAYLTRSRTGTDTATLTESQATFDAKWGAANTATEVALADATKNLTARTEYDAFGRVIAKVVPSKRNADNSVVEVKETYSYHYCVFDNTAVTDSACLKSSLGLSAVPVAYASQRLTTATGAEATSAPVKFVTAYYVESVPKYGNTIIGAKSRVHYDALHREIAKETQTADGRWSRTLTAYDALGQVAATWGAHFTNDTVTLIDESRQWTSARDVLHRPVEAKHKWRATTSAAGAVTTLTGKIKYEGLRTTQIVPTGNLPAGESAARERVTIKNAAGQTAQTIDPTGATLNMAYDGFGNLVRTVDALGFATTITYTATTARFKTSMSDPDKGTWSYTYDALGQLKTQKDARNKTTTLTYDTLGRMTKKATGDLIAEWSYGTYKTATTKGHAAGAACAYGLPRLCQSWTADTTAAPGVMSTSTQHIYDTLARAVEKHDQIDRVYVSKVAFDSYGRVLHQTYPTGLALENTYSAASGSKPPGVLVTVAEKGNSARKFWSIVDIAQPFDAHGNVLEAKLGNGVSINNSFDRIGGKALTLAAGKSSAATDTFEQHYTYDKVENLSKRQDMVTVVTEDFTYDVLDRLVSYRVDSGNQAADRTVTLAYNALGNILSKTDVGSYSYVTNDGNGGPHAVTRAGGTSYTYDANGNVLSTSGMQTRTHTWTDFNLPKTLAYGSRKFEFGYDDQYKRVKEVVTSAGGASRVLYLLHPDNAGGLSYEREETWSGSHTTSTMTRNENRHYISVPGAMVVVKTVNANTLAATLNGTISSAANDTLYWHRDSLGSVVAVSNDDGDVMERTGYDAWGRRLLSNGIVDLSSSGPAHGDRGYTGHEHMDELGLIHMNGRVYDPVVARFLSADPVVQSPGDLQNYNAYSYVLNNPLKYTDPSGHCFGFLGGVDTAFCIAVGGMSGVKAIAFFAGMTLAANGNEHWSMVGSAMMMYGAGGANGILDAGIGSATSPVSNAFAAGALSGYISSGGDLQATAISGFTAGAFGAAGSYLPGFEQKVIAHMLIGCASSAASGGKCGPGAMAAGFGKIVSAKLDILPNDSPEQYLATMFAGGTASVIGGGKFANGAIAATMGYIFNQLLTQEAAQAAAEARNRAVMGGACVLGFETRCTGIMAGTPEAQAKAAALATNIAAVADATDKAAQVIAVGCVATANPCAVPAAATSAGAQAVSTLMAPPGPRETALGALSDFSQAAMERLIRISPATFFFGTAAVIVGTEALKPAAKAADQPPSR